MNACNALVRIGPAVLDREECRAPATTDVGPDSMNRPRYRCDEHADFQVPSGGLDPATRFDLDDD
jgi:hypothetical protein